MFGPCKVCQEKQARIVDLKSQIATLERLAIPPASGGLLPSVAVEADSILGGEPQSEAEAQENIAREAALIFSGNLE